METYHQRSNVETCFHMLKQRYDSHLKTKNFIANQNELKARVLCHNFTVLIQEAFESGLVLDESLWTNHEHIKTREIEELV